MRKASLAAISVAALMLLSAPVCASTLDFTFSFTSAGGTVTGEIYGLSDNTSGEMATDVVIDSAPAAFGFSSFPVDTGSAVWAVGSNQFTVSGGVLTGQNYFSCSNSGCDGSPPAYVLTLDSNTNTYELRYDGTVSLEASTATFAAATPLPATLPLFVTGLGSIAIFGWRRRRKAQALTV